MQRNYDQHGVNLQPLLDSSSRQQRQGDKKPGLCACDMLTASQLPRRPLKGLVALLHDLSYLTLMILYTIDGKSVPPGLNVISYT